MSGMTDPLTVLGLERGDPLAARIARETVHDLASAERMVRDARRHDLTDDQIAALHERSALTIYLAAFASIEYLIQTITREG